MVMPGESSLSSNDQEHLRLVNALRESELLRELSELLASSLDLTHILQVLVRRTTEVCEVERCAVWLLDESRSLLRPSAYHLSGKGLNSKAIQTADNVWRRSTLPFSDPTVHRLLEENGMLVLEDLQAAPGTSMRRIAEKFLVHSVLIVALIREGRPVGVMSLDNPGRLASSHRSSCNWREPSVSRPPWLFTMHSSTNRRRTSAGARNALSSERSLSMM